MIGIVAVDFGVAVEANGNRVANIIGATICRGIDVVGFNLHAAKPVTDAAPSMASSKKFSDIISIERHVFDLLQNSDYPERPITDTAPRE